MKQRIKPFEELDLKKNKNIQMLSTLLAMTLLSPSVFAANVASVSPETFAQYGKENAFWEITVRCEGIESERTIQRKTDGNDWCPKDSNLCDSDKDKAAANACSDEYSSIVNQGTLAKEQEKQAQIARDNAQRQEALKRQQEQEVRRQQAAASKANSADQAKLRNKISIQEDRIKLDQEKLELRRQQLVLERRAVEIEDILETLE